MSDENPNGVNLRRRGVLRTLSAAAVTTGVAGTATATEPACNRSDVVEEYRTVGERRRTFARHAGELVSELARRSLLDSADPAALPLEAFEPEKTRMRPDESDDVSAVTALQTEDGDCVTLLMTVKNTPDHTIRVFVKPELDESYALVRRKDDGSKFAIDTATEETRLEPSNHCDAKADYYCGDQCGGGCVIQEGILYTTHYLDWYRCGSDFHDCCSKETGTDCGAEDCWETCTT